ncbi:MAG: hypothetical protein U0Q15_17150 [Kineosporiaceae bacterium]
MAVSDAGAVAPAEVSLRWRPVHGSSPAVPLISVGLLLLVAGAVAAGVIVMQRRSPVDEPDEDEPTPVASRVPARDTLPTGPLTSELPVVPAGAVVSSRRAARAAREASQAAGVGPAPAAPDVAPPAPAPAQGAGEEDADAERPADPATTVLSLGRHRTADLFTSQPLPGRRGARSADAPAEPSAEGEEPAASPAFRFGPADPPPAAQAGPAGPAEHGRGEDA